MTHEEGLGLNPNNVLDALHYDDIHVQNLHHNTRKNKIL
jgi:hypothetical protein